MINYTLDFIENILINVGIGNIYLKNQILLWK
jgi:hypothetical protein